MDATKQISFIELMKIDDIRRHVFKYVPMFSDIESLSKTCRCLCLLISRDPMRGDVVSIRDNSYLNIKFKQCFEGGYKVPIFESVDIVKRDYFFERFEESNRNCKETIIEGHQTCFEIISRKSTYTPEESVLIAQEIAEKMMLNHHSRSNVETLSCKYYFNSRQRSFLLECLSYMNHPSVKRIELSGYILKICKCLRDRSVWNRDIFGGFPNLKEVIFDVKNFYRQHYRSFGNGNAIEYVISSLGTKGNGTIILNDIDIHNIDLIINVEELYGLCNRYGVKIKLNTELMLVHWWDYFITNVRLLDFFKFIENCGSYGNLEELKLIFWNLIITDNIKHICPSNLERYSLRNCRKPRKLELQYFDDFSNPKELY